jgi:hypothetical protein
MCVNYNFETELFVSEFRFSYEDGKVFANMPIHGNKIFSPFVCTTCFNLPSPDALLLTWLLVYLHTRAARFFWHEKNAFSPKREKIIPN